MISYYSVDTFLDSPCVIAIGCFDGVHLGHSMLIREAKRIANEKELPIAVWSFSEPPKNHFFPNSTPLLTTVSEKRELMKKQGADIFVSVTFTDSIASLSPEDFFNTILVERLKATHIVCGFNYRFGKNGKGDTDLLTKLCAERGIGISVLPPVRLDDITVSSSEIRAALDMGDLELVNSLLGRPFSIKEKVIDGQHLGRTLGFPTINQAIPNGKAMPTYGVYLSKISYGRLCRYGITNVGIRPTVGGNILYAETNIFDYSGDLYGKTVKVELLKFIRAEKKFRDLETLSEQVRADIETAKKLLNKLD